MRIHTTIIFPELWVTIDFVRPFSLSYLGQRGKNNIWGYHTGIEDVIRFPHRSEAYMITMLFKFEKFAKGSLAVGKAIREAMQEHLKHETSRTPM